MGAAQCMPSLRRTAATDGPYAATRGQRLAPPVPAEDAAATSAHDTRRDRTPGALHGAGDHRGHADAEPGREYGSPARLAPARYRDRRRRLRHRLFRSEEHTSELQSLMRISYAVFCLKKKKKNH